MLGGLYEREDELARVDALMTAAGASRGGVLLITGPAGIGKTVLLESARERAGQAGMRVLAGRGRELESGFSFGVVRQLFEPFLAGASAVEREALLAGAARRALIALEDFRSQAGAVPLEAESEPPFAVMHGLYWLAVNASAAAPLLVAVDDLHWADQASLRFVLYLADRLAGLPVALALSWRVAETGDDADRLARLELAAVGGAISLTALSQNGVRALLTREFGTAPAEQFATASHAVTGGNAFLLRELIRQLRADGIGPDEEAAAQVAALGPRSVARAVASRVARLGPAAGELARAAAVLGDGAQLRHAGMLEVLELLDHALDHGRLLARVDSDSLMAAQALLGPVMLEQLDRAGELADQLLAQSRSRGSVVGLVIAGCMHAAVRACRGELVGAETDVRTVVEIAVEYGIAFAIPSALWYGADALIERPGLADIAALADIAGLPPDFARTASGALLREVRGRLALAAGDLSTARAELKAAAGIYEALHLVNPGASCWRSALALAVAAEDPAEARRLATSELEDARQAGLPRPAGIALRTRGLLEGDERGLADLREAAELAAGSGARLEHARALVELGAALRRANQRTAARGPLRGPGPGLPVRRDAADGAGQGRAARRRRQASPGGIDRAGGADHE